MRQNPRHHHNTGYQSSGPLAPPTTLGPDGIPRPTRGPQAGPVLGFNIKACCYGFCQCIYDLIVFIFCCGFCFWMVHLCCHDNDEDYDSNRRNNNSGNSSNNNRTPYKAIPDPKQENKNKHIHSSYQNPNPNPRQTSNSNRNNNNNNNNPNTNSGQDLVINTTNVNTTNSNPNSVNSINSNSGGNRTASTKTTGTKAAAIAGTTNDVTISYHDNYQSQANAGAGVSQTQNTSTNTNSNPTSGEKLGATSMQQQRNESNPEEQYMI